MKMKYLIFILFLSLLSCDDGIDKTILEHTSSKIHITESGFITNTILDMGNDEQDYIIYLNKSGYIDREANIAFKYAEEIIDSYIEDKEDIFVLPSSCISFNDDIIIMGNDQAFYKTGIKFIMPQLRKFRKDNPEKQLLLPLIIQLRDNDEYLEITHEKDYIIFNVDLVEPFAELKNKGSVVPVSIDMFRNKDLNKISFPVEINLPFENEKYEFNFSCEADPLLLDEYNDKYGTAYEMLPEASVLPDFIIDAEEQSCKGIIIINCAELPSSIVGWVYMLPFKITESGNDSIPIQEEAICYFKIKLTAKWSGSWKNTIHESESGISTTPGNVYDTYLYSRRDALEEIKDYTIVSALSFITDEEAIICPGWAGTMFEQCSPIIKVTDEDAGNGKLKIDILAGWAYEGAGWTNPSVANNNSTYDTVSNEIYLDYTGSFTWGDFRFQRTFSGQIPFD